MNKNNLSHKADISYSLPQCNLSQTTENDYTQCKNFTNFYVALTIQKQVFEFEVTVDDRVLVKISEGQDNLSTVEPRAMLSKASFAREVEKQLSAVHVFHHEAQVMRRRKRIPMQIG